MDSKKLEDSTLLLLFSEKMVYLQFRVLWLNVSFTTEDLTVETMVNGYEKEQSNLLTLL